MRTENAYKPDGTVTRPTNEEEPDESADVAAGAGIYGDEHIVDDLPEEKRSLPDYAAVVIFGFMLAALGALIAFGRNKKE